MKVFYLPMCCALSAMLFCSCSDSVSSSDSSTKESPADTTSSDTLEIMKMTVLEDGPDMLNYGHVNLDMPADSFLKVFEYGDYVNVILDSYDTIYAPVVGNYDDVSSGEYLVRASKGKPYITVGINYGLLGVSLGIAEKAKGSAETNYVLKEGVELPINVIVKMDEKGGYLDNLKMRDAQSQGTSREEYPDLTDEEYANFRMVTTTGMGKGVLYRSSSPIDPTLGRSSYVDSLASEAKIKVFVNLTDTKNGAMQYEGFDESYYASQDVLYLGLPASFGDDSFKEGFVKGLRYIIDHEGPYLEHCREGKDRAGFVAAVLEALMGASLEEIKEDYVKTYTNYYNVVDGKQVKLTKEQKDWFAGIIVQNIGVSYSGEGVTFESLDKADLAAITENYLINLGLDKDEIDALKARLSGK